MPIKGRITSFERTAQLLVDSRLSPQERSLRIAQYARGEIDKIDKENARVIGSTVPKTITVNGRQGAPLESANPDRGIIVADWQLIDDVLQWIFATLRARSPRLSGEYIRSHKLYADGAECDPQRPPIAKEYTFLNLVPYSRKIEIGKTKSGRDFVIQVENRIYERTANDAKAKFGNVAKIRSTFSSTVGGKARADRTPAIVVTIS